jgi:hypothetical protein
MRQMITACYNSQLEMSYCMDEFAMPESRADDTLTETDSVVNFTDMVKNETAFVKVSEYLPPLYLFVLPHLKCLPPCFSDYF